MFAVLRFVGIYYAVDTFNTCLTAVIDKHAPTKTRTVIVRPHTPWYNDDLRSQKSLRRQLERKWRKSGTESDRLAYCHQRQLVSSIIPTTRLENHTIQITYAAGGQRQLFKIVAKPVHVRIIRLAYNATISAKRFRKFALDS